MKKILTESQRKALITEREQAIIESFAKTFNSIKRIDENELGYQTNGAGLINHIVTDKKTGKSNNIYLAKATFTDDGYQTIEPIKRNDAGEDQRRDKKIGNYADGNSIDENDHEDWDLENEKQKYGINPEIEPTDLQDGE